MMDMTRRHLFTGLCAVLAQPAFAGEVWPQHPITLVHGFPAGGPVDIASRIMADGLSKRLAQRVIVEARPGATGISAAVQVARAAPDGYTLMGVPASYTATAAMYRTLPYRPVGDFSMISMTVEYPIVLATHADHSIRSLADLVRIAKSRSSPLQYGTAGVGSLQHLAMELFAKMAGIRLQHIPYKGGAPAITDLVGKHIDLVPDPPTALIDLINDGTLRGLAVTGATRFPSLPDVPTIAELGFVGYNVTGFQGIVGPAGIPVSIVNRLNKEIEVVLTDPTYVQQFNKLGNGVKASSPDGLRAALAGDIAKWAKVVSDAAIERI